MTSFLSHSTFNFSPLPFNSFCATLAFSYRFFFLFHFIRLCSLFRGIIISNNERTRTQQLNIMMRADTRVLNWMKAKVCSLRNWIEFLILWDVCNVNKEKWIFMLKYQLDRCDVSGPHNICQQKCQCYLDTRHNALLTLAHPHVTRLK